MKAVLELQKEELLVKTAVVLDTNVFIHDPNVLKNLFSKDVFVFLPWVVILELDDLKMKPDVSVDAQEAIANIEKAINNEESSLEVMKRPSFRNLKELDKNNPNHLVIATAKTVWNLYKDKFSDVKIYSRDAPVRILANELGIKAQDYASDSVEEEKAGDLKTINVDKSNIQDGKIAIKGSNLGSQQIVENEGVICFSDYNPFTYAKEKDWIARFAAVKKGENFEIIKPDIGALKVSPFSLNGNGYNWFQHIAFFQLLDPAVKLCLLQGGAGSGKTLLSLASAIHQRKSFRQILITRPMIPLEDEDRMGTLPGNVEEKMSPWLQPIWQALNYLKDQSDSNKKLIESMVEDRKIYFVPLDYIRGMTFYRDLVIIDDAQNLTPHQVKTIITRAGMHAKFIFTGDLGQIDRKRRLDRRSSGLAFAAKKLTGNQLVSITKFKETVRSPLADLAERCL